jgi:osmotically-inducible protein OsmY
MNRQCHPFVATDSIDSSVGKETGGTSFGLRTVDVAANVVRHLLGVKGVSNRLSLSKPLKMNIEPPVKPVEVERAIKSAFKRSAVVDANKIRVETNGGNVELFGNVRNLAEREEAERAAWAAPGVFSVDNQLTVKWFEFSQ